jgi:hypothetical protein
VACSIRPNTGSWGPQHAIVVRYWFGERLSWLQWAAATWDPLPFDADAARAYGRVFAAVRAAGRTSRSRVADLLIASTAAAHGLPVYTRNPADLEALASVVRVVAV